MKENATNYGQKGLFSSKNYYKFASLSFGYVLSAGVIMIAVLAGIILFFILPFYEPYYLVTILSFLALIGLMSIGLFISIRIIRRKMDQYHPTLILYSFFGSSAINGLMVIGVFILFP